MKLVIRRCWEIQFIDPSPAQWKKAEMDRSDVWSQVCVGIGDITPHAGKNYLCHQDSFSIINYLKVIFFRVPWPNLLAIMPLHSTVNYLKIFLMSGGLTYGFAACISSSRKIPLEQQANFHQEEVINNGSSLY